MADELRKAFEIELGREAASDITDAELMQQQHCSGGTCLCVGWKEVGLQQGRK